jgi:hypothetical protein
MNQHQTQMGFSKQLIKGKIAELIFDQMFRQSSGYTVIPFGYETIMPEIIQYAERADRKELFENISNAPDFALVSHDPKQVLLVEVKFRTRIDIEEIKKTAALIREKWKLAWLFIATPTGFYFDPCSDLESEPHLTMLDEHIISLASQKEYLILLNQFINS